MNKKDLIKLIKNLVDSEKIKNVEEQEWDSLAHLSILIELEKIFPNKITSIAEIAEANNYKKLEKILLSKKLLKND
jgi:acyl carrier protein